jgi:acid stress-induced BolA-like protein IbaG/YrbA
MNPEQVSKLIENGLPQATVRVRSDDNTHYESVVVSELFAGKRPLARHQMVYQCLGKLMGNEIHALAIRAHTPAEWGDLEQAGKV